MKIKKKIFILLCVIMLTSCATTQTIENVPPPETTIEETTVTTTAPVTTIDEIELDVPEVTPGAFTTRLEAEKGELTGDLTTAKIRKGYSGTGYVTHFTQSIENSFRISAEIPTSQHYDITVSAASDTKRTNTLLLNGISLGEIHTTGTTKFEQITFTGIYIEKGTAEFCLEETGGWIDLDYISIQNNKDIPSVTTDVAPTLINSSANEKTKNTMQFLTDNFGENCICGQYISTPDMPEMDLIYRTTGKHPAMLLADLSEYSLNEGTPNGIVETAINWGNSGGLVSLMWHWKAPLGNPSFYADETTFDLSKAVTDIDIAELSLEEIQKLYEEKKISEETFAIIKDIDNISAQLKKLQDAGVTVLWRPLHEAGGGWFWWGNQGKDAYKWLWNLMLKRQTNFHKLDNLIWIWNAQLSDWYVGDNACDIISADIYTVAKDYSSHISEFLNLNNLSKNKKILAISECGIAPDPDFMARDNSVWSFFGLWYGEYITDEFGEYSELYTNKEQLIKIYNSAASTTLESLPDLTKYQTNK